MLLLAGCKEKRYFTGVTGEICLVRIGFEDKSFRDFTVVSDVLYAGSDTSSRYKMIFYLPDGWDNSYPIFLDRYVPTDGPALPYGEWTAIPDILLAEHFLKERDADLPGDSKNILTAAYFDFE